MIYDHLYSHNDRFENCLYCIDAIIIGSALMATKASPRAQPKPIIPYSKLPASLQRKRNRVNSQRTLDTRTSLPEEQQDLQSVLQEQ